MATLCAQYGTQGKTVFLNASAYNHFNSQDPHSQAPPPYSDLIPLALDSRQLDFLTEVTRIWEQAAEPTNEAGIRVVHLGFGMLADKNSTGFSNILSLFQRGIGGRIGSGEQQIPMVTMRDALASMLYCIRNPELSGYVNIVGFNVRQKDLAKELAKQIDKIPPSKQGWMYTSLKWLLCCCKWFNNVTKPEMIIKLGLGIFGEELLLKGLRVESGKLTASGFEFQDVNVASAIQYALGKDQLAHIEMITSSYSKMGLQRRLNRKKFSEDNEPLLPYSGSDVHESRRKTNPMVVERHVAHPPTLESSTPTYNI